jgi:hypothetical protein
VLLFLSAVDHYSEEKVRNVDRVWYFDEGPRAEFKIVTKTGSQKADEPGHPGGLHLIRLLRLDSGTVEPPRAIDPPAG